MGKWDNYLHQKYGRLAITDVFRKNQRTVAKCRCDCGNVKEVELYFLKKGLTVSCKCFNKEITTKHGLYGTKEYRAWQHMLRRCDDANSNYSHLYIEKGITVCDRWKAFNNFLEDMGTAPSAKHSVDRLEGDKGYYKENCRWATPLQQSRNTSRNRIIEYNGEKKCASEWAEIYAIKYPVLLKRLYMGWDFVRAITTPISTAHQRFTKLSE